MTNGPTSGNLAANDPTLLQYEKTLTTVPSASSRYWHGLVDMEVAGGVRGNQAVSASLAASSSRCCHPRRDTAQCHSVCEAFKSHQQRLEK